MSVCWKEKKHEQINRRINSEQLRSDIPAFALMTLYVFTLRLWKNSRTYPNLRRRCYQTRGAGISETYTVRKVSNGVGVERTFPLHTPRVAQIEVVRYGKVRRAKLYYLRNLRGKAARIQERRR